MIKKINQWVKNTEILVFGYNPKTQLFTYSRPFTVDEAESLANETNRTINSQYKDAKGLTGGLQTIGTELINISTLKGIIVNRVLMQRTQNQQWLPTIEEGIELQKQGMLPSKVRIDFGLVLYDEQFPDQEIAKSLMMTATEKGYVTPVLASFNSLDLDLGGKAYGVTPKIVSADGLIFGDEARMLLGENSFHKENSGVRRLGRSCSGGYWDADWDDDLGDFSVDCRVGRISTEGSAQKLEEEALIAFAPIRKSLDSILDPVGFFA